MSLLVRVRYHSVALTLLTALGLLFASWPALAAESDAGAGALGVQEAAEQALAHDLASQIAQLNLENARITYEKNVALNLLSDSAYNRRSAESNLRTAQITFATRQADVAASAVTRYFTLLATELDVEITAAELEVALLTLESTRRKASMGTAGRLDLLDAEVEVGTAELAARRAEKSLLEEREAFAIMLGTTADALPVLDKKPVPPEVSIDLETALERATDHSAALVGAESKLALVTLDRERALAEGVAPLDQETADLAVEIAKLELEDARRNLRLSVVRAFDEVARTRSLLELEEIQFELALERHSLVRQQFDAGLKTQSELIQADATLAEAEKGRLTALRNYFSAVLTLQKLVGGEPFGNGAHEA